MFKVIETNFNNFGVFFYQCCSIFKITKANYLSMSNVQVMEAWMGSGKSANIRCLDLDRSNNMTFIIDRPDKYQPSNNARRTNMSFYCGNGNVDTIFLNCFHL